MATAHRRTAIANGKRRNRAKRKLSLAQIKAGFGGKRRQSAAKHRKRTKPAAKKNRKRSVAKHRNAPKKRNTARHRTRTAPKKHRRVSRPRATKRRRKARRNVGEVVSLTLGSSNSARRNGKMATTRKHHRRAKHNTRRRTAKHNRRRTHRNPFGGGWSSEITNAMFVVAGAVGTKLGTQLVLGTSNTGVMGYAGSLAVGGVLAFGTKAILKNPKAAAAVFSGAVVQVILRMISDYTPFGSYVSGLGMGDYFASNWVTPQRYVDALNSAQVQIPAGWAPTTVIQSSGVTAGMQGYYDNSGGNYY